MKKASSPALVALWIERRSREVQSSVIKFIVAVRAEVDKVNQGVYLCDGGGGRKGGRKGGDSFYVAHL